MAVNNGLIRRFCMISPNSEMTQWRGIVVRFSLAVEKSNDIHQDKLYKSKVDVLDTFEEKPIT